MKLFKMFNRKKEKSITTEKEKDIAPADKKLKINYEIIKYFDSKEIKTLSDILELPDDFIMLQNINLILRHPDKILTNKTGNTKRVLLKLSIENKYLLEIDFSQDIKNLIKYQYYEKKNLGEYYYYSNKISNILITDPLGLKQTVSREIYRLNEPECGISTLEQIYKDFNIKMPKQYSNYKNILVSTNNVKLNNDFVYFYDFSFNEKKVLIKLKISKDIQHKIPNIILMILCKYQRIIYSEIMNINTNIDLTEETQYHQESNKELSKFLVKLLCYGIYLEQKELPKELPKELSKEFDINEYRRWAGGSSNKYQLYIFKNKYFIIYNNKKKYLTLKNIYTNNNNLYIIINKNKFLIYW